MKWMTRVRQHEIGLRFRYGDYVRALQPGAYWHLDRIFGWERTRIEVVGKTGTRFEHPLLDWLVRDEALASQLLVVDLTEQERALVWKDGRLGWILGKGRHAFWREPYRLEVERFNVADFRFQHGKAESVLEFAGADRFLESYRIRPYERCLIFRQGNLAETLGPGLHVFWKHAGAIEARVVDLREQVAEVAGQEIMTADKVTLRVNLLVSFQAVDPEKAVTVVSDYAQAVYREAQLALRAAVGARKIDELLADKEAVGGDVRDALSRRASEFGVAVRGVGLRDIILPGDMKTILNQVIEAQKQAEANLIRRREETAAARSQANTARLLADNPVLARMKELEGVQAILAGAKTSFVFGSGDLVGQLRSLVADKTGDE